MPATCSFKKLQISLIDEALHVRTVHTKKIKVTIINAKSLLVRQFHLSTLRLRGYNCFCVKLGQLCGLSHNHITL